MKLPDADVVDDCGIETLLVALGSDDALVGVGVRFGIGPDFNPVTGSTSFSVSIEFAID